MRVLHVIARLNVGGTARYITQLANELPKHGIETFVATGFVQGAEVEDESAQSIELIRVPSMGRSINPVKDHFASKQLDKIIAEVKPDIIHTHTFKAGYLIRKKKQPVPVIHTFHGHLLDDPEFSGFKSKVIVAVEGKLAKKSVKLITVGHRVGEELIDHNIGKREQFVNIPPGLPPLNINDRSEALRNLGIPDIGLPIVGWIARVTGVKNPLRALEIAREMPETLFLIAGGGDLLDDVRAAAPPNAKVLGWTNPEDLFGAVDIVLSTSRNEGMPIALIEAQMAGKPIVALDVGSIGEILKDGENGFLVTLDNSEIVNALQTLFHDTEKRISFSQRAKESSSRFTTASMIEKHIRVYNDVVAL
jgi:glycosyltransferase involved in cell wall biosynthesis